VISVSLNVPKQLVSLNSAYDSWIIVHYHFWILLAIIFSNIVCCASLHAVTKEIREWFQHKHWFTERITQLRNQMISINNGVNVMHYFSHLIRSHESRNTHFLNNSTQLEALLVFADCLYLVSGWDWIALLFGLICEIEQRWKEMLASCKSEWAFERQWLFGWIRGATTKEHRWASWGMLSRKQVYTEGIERAQN